MVCTYVYTRKYYIIGRAKVATRGTVGVDIYAENIFMRIMRGTQTSHNIICINFIMTTFSKSAQISDTYK